MGHDTVDHLLYIVLANVLGLMIGFMLGVVIRNSAGAIVGYFVFSLVLPTLSGCWPRARSGSATSSPGSTSTSPQSALFDGDLTSAQWAHLGVAGGIWLIVPLAVGSDW